MSAIAIVEDPDACASCGGPMPEVVETEDGRAAANRRVAKFCTEACKRREEARRYFRRHQDAKAQELSKAQRLAIAGIVAPHLRAARKPRIITTTDAEGRPVRTITDVELAQTMLRRADIELSTDAPGGVRACELCKVLFPAPAVNAKRCYACRLGRCVDCAVPITDSRARRCRPCADKERWSGRAPRAPRAPCAKCGTDLWSVRKSVMRKKCPACPRPPTPVCVTCAGTIKGYPRKGQCFTCYMRARYGRQAADRVSA
jgi:hypothetical protein